MLQHREFAWRDRRHGLRNVVFAMNVAVHSGCVVGIEARSVLVEARVGPGLPGFELVGLPQRSAREARVRVKSALLAMGFEVPRRNLVINLAPADDRKSGSSLDLAIAIAVLGTNDTVLPEKLQHTLLLGELSLGGSLRGVRGVLPQLRSAKARGLRRACVPIENAPEASLVPGLEVVAADNLQEVVAWLNGDLALTLPETLTQAQAPASPDMADVRGQHGVRRAMEIAAVGHHNLLLVGPPGAGKTMLARRLPGLLAPPNPDEALDIATVLSAAGLETPRSLQGVLRPFRAPHHTASAPAMVGGGDPVRPGSVTLAHRGVLFLDELPEFRRDVIETLRTTMSTGEVQIARAREHVTMPAAPLVIAAMNPCPCGYAGDPDRLCRCSPFAVERYRGRVSGPLVDRFDLHVLVPRVPVADFRLEPKGEPTAIVAARVRDAQTWRRSRRPQGGPVSLDELLQDATPKALTLLDASVDAFGMSARGYVKCLRIARTIADLHQAERIHEEHIAEALQYRVLDRNRSPATQGIGQ